MTRPALKYKVNRSFPIWKQCDHSMGNVDFISLFPVKQIFSCNKKNIILSYMSRESISKNESHVLLEKITVN